ncbi:serine/threonine-protein kinase [Streptomyces sp. NBC_00102]|uniref:serine/threonine-protein kinase n=1 Tax=Streptomyces sp. NBC_00102 TaxID=2975652 RepID=UPI0022592959|nr:serine/threonine-protein kinase [Streptomyces sp. NBC_00102]MCX5400313.1 serine/threonine protein kinase [Streptomyces sp. NBC_00102]
MRPLTDEDPPHLGPYWLLGRLGSGGMGRVYLARHRDETGESLVAVKTIRAEIAEHPTFRARFAREVRAARRVGDVWTAPVLDANTDGTPPWIATAYIPGPTLQSVVDSGFGPLPSASAHVLAHRMALALDAIHRAGIVHRDLKPSNVLLTAAGPRVIDFGIARALEGTDADTFSSTGTGPGSPRYMAPEQVRGQEITTACDVFSLGSVLAYAAAGRTPFGDGESGIHALLFRIAYEEPDLTGIPESVADLVRDCLAKDPAERPTTTEIVERTRTAPEGAWLPPSLLARVHRFAEEPVPSEPARERGCRTVDRAGSGLSVLTVHTSEPSANWDLGPGPDAPHLSSPPADDTAPTDTTEAPTPKHRRGRIMAAALTVGVLAAAAGAYGLRDDATSPQEYTVVAAGPGIDFSGAWMTGHEEGRPLLVVRLDMARRITSARRVDVVSATGDVICRGSALATPRGHKELTVSEFTMKAVGSGPAHTCGVPSSMHLEIDPRGDSMYWAESESSSTWVEPVDPGAVHVPAAMRGVWEDGNGLRISFGEGGLGAIAVTGELTTGKSTCRWEAALLAHQDGMLKTTGAQPVAHSPKCPAPRGTYDYELRGGSPEILVRSSTAEAGATMLHRADRETTP